MGYLTDRTECLAIAELCRDPQRRFVGRWQDHQKSKWYPQTVRQPGCKGKVFSDPEAWEFIAQLIDDYHAMKIVTMDEPAGAIGYVMVVPIEPGHPDLYIKLTLSKTGNVIGRSFHYSCH